MTTLVRRLSTVVGGAGAAVLLAAGPASAHFCYLLNPADEAAAGRGASNGWTTFEDAVRQHLDPNMCDAGIAVLAAAGGVKPSTLLLDHATIAGGTHLSPKGPGNPAVGYLDFDSMFGTVGQAYAACAK
jgi:hypothetical protein